MRRRPASWLQAGPSLHQPSKVLDLLERPFCAIMQIVNALLATRRQCVAEPTALEDSFTAVDLLALQGIVEAASNVDTFVSKTPESRDQCREALQSLYRLAADGLKACGDSHKPQGVAKLPPGKLVTANFHVEQIWGQLDVLAEATMKRVRCAHMLLSSEQSWSTLNALLKLLLVLVVDLASRDLPASSL